MRNENVVHPLRFLSLIRFQLRDSSSSKLRHKICGFLRRGYKRVEISSVPFGDRAIWLDVVRFLQIKQQPFVFRRNRFVTPVTRRCFATNVASKDSQGIPMIAIAANDLPSCVTAGKKDREYQGNGAPDINAR